MLRARSPEDLLAFAPLAIGFRPERSLVVLTTGGGSFHARIDLPDRLEDVAAVVEAVLGPARRHRVDRVVLLAYGESTEVLVATCDTAHEAFTAAGVEVLELLRAHAGRWWSMFATVRDPDDPGTPYDDTGHPFTARSVLEGHVVRGSRAELAAVLRSRPEEVRRVAAELARADEVPTAAWVTATVQGHLAAGTVCDPAEAARLGRALAVADRRDAAWTWMRRDEASALVDLWVDLVGRLPRGLVAGAAAALAVSAWVAGQGALAWCAVDRCRAEEPDHPLAELVAGLLETAASPLEWDGTRAGPLGAA